MAFLSVHRRLAGIHLEDSLARAASMAGDYLVYLGHVSIPVVELVLGDLVLELRLDSEILMLLHLERGY